MRSWYGTVAATAALLAGCDSSAERVEIVAHYVPACAPEADSAAVQLELFALGDFDRSNESVSILGSTDSARAVSLPPETRAVELSTLGDRGYWGTGALDTQHQISVLLWPREQSCALARLEQPAASSWLLGASSDPAQLLCLAGAPAAEGSAGVAIDLRSARATPLGPGSGLAAPRAFASLSGLAGGILIAGGSDPESGRPRADAELFDPATLTFAAAPLRLAIPRTRHAAVVLPSGAALLIGGESEDGDALASVELVSAEASGAPRALALLGTPRIQPSALLLEDGRILVGGGYVWAASSRDPRAGRQPLPGVELLSLELTAGATMPIRLEPAALERAFVALPGGGALAVGGCQQVVREGEPCLPCGNGPGCISRAVWWIDARGDAHSLPELPEALASAEPRLVSAAEGAPWLLANGRLARFDPWQASFVTVEESGYAAVQEPLALGPGSFVWLQRDGDALSLLGQHASQRGPLTQDVAPLLVGSGRAVVPHRPPTSAVPEAELTLRYGVASGLELAGAAAVVSIADTHYADFTLDLMLADGPPPLLRLAGTGSDSAESVSFGGLECPWPELSSSSATSPSRLRVLRTGDEVSLLLADGPAVAAPLPCRRELPERVRIELGGTSLGISRLLRIEVRRSIDPAAPAGG